MIICVVNDFEEFRTLSNAIITNRDNADLYDMKEKVYTRYLYSRD